MLAAIERPNPVASVNLQRILGLSDVKAVRVEEAIAKVADLVRLGEPGTNRTLP